MMFGAYKNRTAIMATKICFKCDKEFPMKEFYKHPQMSDGHVNKCKECNKSDVNKNRALKIDYYLEYDRARASNPNRVSARLAYSKTIAGKNSSTRAKARWTESNQIKRAASTIVGNAVRDRRLIKPSICSECNKNSSRIHGHHDDYAYPMTVRWMCAKCHCIWHKINGHAKNG